MKQKDLNKLFEIHDMQFVYKLKFQKPKLSTHFYQVKKSLSYGFLAEICKIIFILLQSQEKNSYTLNIYH